MSLEIINNPILVMLQDKGRYGYSDIGVTNSGVMDEYAYLSANKMLGNSLETNILEIAFSNVIFKANASTQIAITGAICELFINDISKQCWETHNVKAGDTIKIGKILKGTRVYLAVKDGFDIKKEFGSNSTTIKENLGGIDGQKLKKGDVLAFKETSFSHNIKLKKEFIPSYKDELVLRVVLSYQDEYFSNEEKEKFFSNTFTVTNDFNRMGCKLNGESILCDINGIISEGISFGAIQIPSDGQPIILLKERQTIGGYPKIGSVLAIDCFKLSQVKVNTKIKFSEISLDEATKKIRNFYSSFL
ncbi:biotin-dependent carboxyltransferase family protein [Arcobacter sp. s6]|uniref:biotin-dependent carboxyltransferase family protein n=1 Tax=Arcobacter sp. s6 TaxID=3230363 RepID=UPI0034A02689